MQIAMVAGVRALLQQPNVVEVHHCHQLVGGISVGGWIVLGVVIGFCCGIASTLLFQCYRRRKEERYLKQVPLTPPGRSLEYNRQLSQQPSLDVGGLVAPSHRPPGVAAPASLQATPSQPPKIYGPLTKSITAVPGSMLAMNDSMRSSMRHSKPSSGDVGMGHSDQRPPADMQGNVLPAAQGPLTSSYVALPLQASRLSGVHQGDIRASQPLQGFNSATYGSGPQVPHPIPAVSPDSSDISDFAPLHQQHLPTSILHSSLPECLPSPTAAVPHEMYPRPGQALSQTSSQPGAQEQSPITTVNRAPSTSSSAQKTGSLQLEKQPTAASAGSALEVESAYEEHELDDDWCRLLGDINSRLIAQNQQPLDARERSVAIKKLLSATGTRGVDFAMNAALQEVLEFRRLHGH